RSALASLLARAAPCGNRHGRGHGQRPDHTQRPRQGRSRVRSSILDGVAARVPPTLRHQERISMPEPTPEEDLLETIDELYGAARSAVLDAARAWRIGGGAPWTIKALIAAMDALASAEALLGVAYDAPPATAKDAKGAAL